MAGQSHRKMQCQDFGYKISDLFFKLIIAVFFGGGGGVINRKSGLVVVVVVVVAGEGVSGRGRLGLTLLLGEGRALRRRALMEGDVAVLC